MTPDGMPTDRNEERAMRAALQKAAKARRYAEFTPTSYEERGFEGRVSTPRNTRRRQSE
jgi:hypothetical protein